MGVGVCGRWGPWSGWGEPSGVYQFSHPRRPLSPSSCTCFTALLISALSTSVSSAVTAAPTGTTVGKGGQSPQGLRPQAPAPSCPPQRQAALDPPLLPAARTCELSDGRCRQCLGGQCDHVVHGNHADLTPLIWLQDFDARLALVHSLHVGTQVVHPVETTSALVTQVRLLSWGGRQGSRLPLGGGEDLSGLQLPQSPVFSSNKCSGAATRAAQKPPGATCLLETRKMGSLLKLNLPGPCSKDRHPRLGSGGTTLPTTPAPANEGQMRQVGTSSPVWMMMCLDRSPTFTKALLHTLHL